MRKTTITIPADAFARVLAILETPAVELATEDVPLDTMADAVGGFRALGIMGMELATKHVAAQLLRESVAVSSVRYTLYWATDDGSLREVLNQGTAGKLFHILTHEVDADSGEVATAQRWLASHPQPGEVWRVDGENQPEAGLIVVSSGYPPL